MNIDTLNAFADELVKIASSADAVAQTVVNQVNERQGLRAKALDALRTGWHGTGPEGSPTRMTWMGQGLAPAETRAQMGPIGKAFDTATSLGGATKYLPVGAKSMMALGTAMMLPQVLSKEDPTGQDRSRLERGTGFAANTVGGLAGAGALAKTQFGKKHPLLGSLLGGIGGGLAAEKVVTAPFKALRNRREAKRLKRRRRAEAAAPNYYPTGPVGRMAVGSGALPPTVGGAP